jgi:chemotaxis methyl-accepting protein methylase
MRNCALGRTYARYLDWTVRRCSDRKQFVATFFLRNRPELLLLSRLLEDRPSRSRVSIAVMACSKGAEVYSLVWAVRSARPDLELNVGAVDISQEIVDFAKDGIYSLNRDDAFRAISDKASESDERIERSTSKDQNAWMFERMTSDEMRAMFNIQGGVAEVKSDLRIGISWLCGDAGDPQLQTFLGLQDIVVANRFLCHMKPDAAAKCLRNIAKLVRPGGYLFVTGIDLDVRTQVASDLGWQPVPDLIREIHDGDDSIRRGWPTEYWGLEPFDSKRPDWNIRYASVFQITDALSNKCHEPAVVELVRE